MTIAKITTPGLTTMGLTVAVLWSCLIGERILVRNAAKEQAQVLREINLLRQRQRSEPASTPRQQLPRPAQAVKS